MSTVEDVQGIRRGQGLMVELTGTEDTLKI
jgi:hypothetical protein